MIVTLRLAEEKIKESQVEKGGGWGSKILFPATILGCDILSHYPIAMEFATRLPGRLRHFVAPLHVV